MYWGTGSDTSIINKDINSLINIMIDNDVDPIVLKAVWDQNKNYRNNWDWSNNQSAVLEQSE